MENNSKTNFWELLNKYDIVIPILQRDYAQGRKGKEDLRNRFLSNIKDSLCNNEELKLDFVYGSVEKSQMQPLDGQQRLTTLWLLYWFVAFRSGKLKDQIVSSRLKKFYYATRPSSTDFCKRLVDEFCKIDSKKVENIVDYIKKQHWYYRHYNFDPTIQAILMMIMGDRTTDNKNNPKADNGLEQFWGLDTDFNKLWNQLTKDDCPIQFYHKDMIGDDMPLVDDLYIKMNARGKQLTQFENFKAELIGYQKNKYLDIENDDIDKEFVSNLDNDWVGLFWPYKHKSYYRVDEIYFKFINQFMLNYYLLISNKNDQDIDKTELFQLLSSAHSFSKIEDYKEILDFKEESGGQLETFKKRFQNTMNGLVKYKEHIKKHIGVDINSGLNTNLDYYLSYGDYKLEFIPQYDYEKGSVEKWEDQDNLPVTELRQIPQVIFFGICRFFEKLNEKNRGFEEVDKELADWIKFCYHIGYNPLVNNIGGLRGALRVINEMSHMEFCFDIYSKLSELKEVPNLKVNTGKEQLEEEYYKAKFKKDNDELAALFDEAEKYAFFKGNIRFLLWDEQGNYCDDAEAFKRKYDLARNAFTEKDTFDGKIKNNLCFPNYFNACHNLSEIAAEYNNGDKCIRFNNSGESWKFMLNNKSLCRTTHSFLSIRLQSPLELMRQFCLPNMDYSNMDDEYKKRLEFVQNTVFEENFVKGLMTMEGMVGGNLFLRRWSNWALYPKNAHANEKVIILGSSRNKVLKNLLDKNIIQTEREVKNSFMFYGWDIPFIYKGKKYEWTSDNKLKWTDKNITNSCDISFDIEEEDFLKELEEIIAYEKS